MGRDGGLECCWRRMKHMVTKIGSRFVALDKSNVKKNKRKRGVTKGREPGKSNQIVSAKLGPRIVTYQRNDLCALPEPLDPRSSSYCCGPYYYRQHRHHKLRLLADEDV